MTSSLNNKAGILAELWMNYREDKDLSDFIEYNDIGLPLAYFVYNELVEPTSQAEMYIDETYHLLVYSLGIEDRQYENLDEMLNEASKLDK
jgi:hypothetical protein